MTGILIVDDEGPIRELLDRTLSKAGYACTQAADAVEAGRCLQENNFELALLDINMPGDSGLEFLRNARATCPEMVVIMVTGDDDPRSIDQAIGMGAYSYILKPFDQHQMLVHVKNALHHREIELENRRYRENLEQMLARKIGEIKENEEKFKAISGSALDAIIMIDDNGKISFWNQAAENMFHYSREQVYGENFHHIFMPEWYRDAHTPEFRKFRESGEGNAIGKTLELKAKRRNGEEFPVELSLSSIKIKERWHAIGIVRDISERKKIDEKIRQSEERNRTLIDAAQEGIAVSRGGIQIFVNNKFSEMFGYEKPEELVGKENLMVVHPDDRERVREISLTREAGGDAPTRYEFQGIRKDGQVVYVAISVSQTVFMGETADIAFLMNITELKAAQEALKRAHDRLRQLFAAIDSVMIALDREDRIIEWNSISENMFGISREAVLGKVFSECGIRWDQEAMTRAVSRCKESGDSFRIDDVRYSGKERKDRLLGITINPICEEDGTCVGTMIRAADITERKLLESQLAQAQKLESIGQLAAGIAHEINTPIQYVGDNTRFLQEGFQDLRRLLDGYDAAKKGCDASAAQAMEALAEEIDLEYLKEEIPAAIEQSLEGVERVTKIVRAMKEFSHPGSDEKTPTDLNKAIENTVTVARNEWKYVADLQTDFDESLPPVLCLPGEFNQVVLNMIVNGSHAISDVVGEGENGKGTITISTRKNGEWALIRIEDTGAGIPEEIRQRIFDPFFTTKEVGKGTGQGLSIAHNVIVEKHGGRIDVKSEVGKGTAFTIRLPLEV